MMENYRALAAVTFGPANICGTTESESSPPESISVQGLAGDQERQVVWA